MFNPDLGARIITPYEISIVHSLFNVANTVILFPFSNVLVKIAEVMCHATKTDADEEGRAMHLDDRILNSPSIAIASCVKEIVHLGKMAEKNLSLACETLINKDESAIEQIYEREKKIDNLTKVITQFLVKLCNTDVTTEENNYITSLFHTVHDMERIGDHSENLAEFTQTMIDDELEFSDTAKEELREMFGETEKCVKNSITALENDSMEYAEKVIKEEERVDGLEKGLRDKHIVRLTTNRCSPLVGVVYLDILTNLERVSDLALNVAQVVIKNNTNKQ